MPTARDGLLDAAYAALKSRPWSGVRMVDVAAEAGVSRQTLYNEFGSKEGLAQALVRREIDLYLSGAERALATAARSGADAGGKLTALGAWTMRAARSNPLLRAVLTGCWSDRLPMPMGQQAGQHAGLRSRLPAQRTGEPVFAPVDSPAELVDKVCDRAMAALEPDWPADRAEERGKVCEASVRLVLSYVVAPAAKGEEFERLVRGVLTASQ